MNKLPDKVQVLISKFLIDLSIYRCSSYQYRYQDNFQSIIKLFKNTNQKCFIKNYKITIYMLLASRLGIGYQDKLQLLSYTTGRHRYYPLVRSHFNKFFKNDKDVFYLEVVSPRAIHTIYLLAFYYDYYLLMPRYFKEIIIDNKIIGNYHNGRIIIKLTKLHSNKIESQFHFFRHW